MWDALKPYGPSSLMQVVLGALDIIVGLSGSSEGIGKLKTKLDRLLIFLMRLVPVPDPQPPAVQASEKALTSLVNLAQDRLAASKMLAVRVIGRLMDYLREGACPHPKLMVCGGGGGRVGTSCGRAGQGSTRGGPAAFRIPSAKALDHYLQGQGHR